LFYFTCAGGFILLLMICLHLDGVTGFAIYNMALCHALTMIWKAKHAGMCFCLMC